MQEDSFATFVAQVKDSLSRNHLHTFEAGFWQPSPLKPTQGLLVIHWDTHADLYLPVLKDQLVDSGIKRVDIETKLRLMIQGAVWVFTHPADTSNSRDVAILDTESHSAVADLANLFLPTSAGAEATAQRVVSFFKDGGDILPLSREVRELSTRLAIAYPAAFLLTVVKHMKALDFRKQRGRFFGEFQQYVESHIDNFIILYRKYH